jgi:ribonuclease HI
MGVKWRELMHHAYDRNLVNEFCFGGTPGKSSPDARQIKAFEFELCRLTRKMLMIGDEDMSQCYDNIPCGMGNMTGRKYGMCKEVCVVQGRTLQEARYHLKTKKGVSAEFVKHSYGIPWFGPGQGSTNGPFMWLFISSTCFDFYCAKAKGAFYETPDHFVNMLLHVVGFVDDCTIRVNNFKSTPDYINNPPPELGYLVAAAAKDQQLWHDVMTSVNQQLELLKCKYHLIRYRFKDTGAPVMVDDNFPKPGQPGEPPFAPMVIKDVDGNPLTITHVPSSEALKYLGGMDAPNSKVQQRRALKAKCDQHARAITCSHLTRIEAKRYYLAIYETSVGYPLHTCYFTFKELDAIQSKAHQAMLAKMGYNRSTDLRVVYGPQRLDGIGMFHLYDIQGYGQLHHFMKNWKSPDAPSGKLIRIVMAWAQLMVGISRPLLQDVHTTLPHLEGKWVPSFRDYLSTIGAELELDNPLVPKPQREGDTYIMDLVLEQAPWMEWKGRHIRRINYCRLYLNVVTVSDIATADGKEIDNKYVWGENLHRDQIPCRDWNRVDQACPKKECWSLWRKVCTLLAPTLSNKSRRTPLRKRNRVLAQPLGNWILPNTNTRRTWDFVLHRQSNILYKRQQDGTFTGHSRLRHDYDKDIAPGYEATQPPADSVPVDVKEWAMSYRAIPNEISVIPEPTQAAFVPIFGNHDDLEAWERPLFAGLELLVPDEHLVEALAEEKVIIVTDGSALPLEGKGSFGWIAATTDGTRLISCNGPVASHQHTSYRSEGYGLLSAHCFLQRTMQTYELDSLKEVVIYCDNKSMVRRSGTFPERWECYPNRTMDSEWDVLSQIWSTRRQDLAVPICHIKGHQDRTTPYEELSLEAQLNVDADRLAEAYLETHPDDDYARAPLLPAGRCSLHLQTGTVSHHYKREVREARTRPAMEDYLETRNGWTVANRESIDWEAHRIAMNRLENHRPTLVKHMHDHLPVGHVVSRYNVKYAKNCPSCDEPDETCHHMMLCNVPKRRSWKLKFAKDLYEFLKKQGTEQTLAELMVDGVSKALQGEALVTAPRLDLQVIVDSQHFIGWEQLLKGRLSKEWALSHKAFLGNKATQKKNDRTWVANVAAYLLSKWLELWRLRNEDRHGKDEETRRVALREQTQREVRQMYETYQGRVDDDVAHAFATPLEQKLQLHTSVLRAWINCYRPVFNRKEEYSEQLITR